MELKSSQTDKFTIPDLTSESIPKECQEEIENEKKNSQRQIRFQKQTLINNLKEGYRKKIAATKDKNLKNQLKLKLNQEIVLINEQDSISSSDSRDFGNNHQFEPLVVPEFYRKCSEIKLSKSKIQKIKKDKIYREIRQKEEDEIKFSGIVDEGNVELEKIVEILRPQNLKIQVIASDGNCIYRALENQLIVSDSYCKNGNCNPKVYGSRSDSIPQGINENPIIPNKRLNYLDLRRIASEYIKANRDDFRPFLDEEYQSDEGFLLYCEKIRDTAEWGGETELQALCKALKRCIYVYTEFDALVYGNEYTDKPIGKPPLRLSYHRKLFCSGEHYNSVVPTDFTFLT